MIISNVTPKTFKYFLTRSGIIHLAIILSTATVTSIVYKYSKPNITFIDAAVRVDVVSMPTMTLQELKKVAEIMPEQNVDEAKKGIDTTKTESGEDLKNVKVQQEKVEEDDFLKKKEDTKKNFMSMLKDMSKKSVKDNKEHKGSALPNTGNKSVKLTKEDLAKLKNLVLSGNKVAQGTAIVGTGNTQVDGEFATYASKLPDMIKPYWKLPSYLLAKDLKCRIRIFLADDGSLLNAAIFEGSGDPEFDQRAIESVRRASPFPKLSENIKERGTSGSIVLGFPL